MREKEISRDKTIKTSKKKRKKNRRFRPAKNPACENEDKKQLVINISSIELKQEQTEVLERGPKFCPTPQTLDKEQLIEDVKEGCRRLRLKELFYDDEDDGTGDQTTPKFYKKTFYNPPRGRERELDIYCDTIECLAEKYEPSSNPTHNLSESHRNALNELDQLVKNRTIRISPADKGGATVVQDVDKYIAEGERQLNNPVHYAQVTEDPTKNIAKKSNKIVDALKTNHHIGQKQIPIL